MSDTLQYRRWWMENTTTRNAFYQVFDIQRIDAEGVLQGHAVVTHYGPLKVAEGEFSRPVKGGQVKPKAVQNNRGQITAANDAVLNKRTSGYVLKKDEGRHSITTLAWLLSTFGAAHTHEVNLALGITEPIAEIDAPIVRVDDSTIDRGPMWGSW
jgi:hypothetical protein